MKASLETVASKPVDSSGHASGETRVCKTDKEYEDGTLDRIPGERRRFRRSVDPEQYDQGTY